MQHHFCCVFSLNEERRCFHLSRRIFIRRRVANFALKDHLKSSVATPAASTNIVANMGGGKVRGRQNNSALDGLGTQSNRTIVFSSENPNILQFFLWKVWICQDHPKSTRNWIFIASRTSFGVLLGFQLPWETCTSGSREGCPGWERNPWWTILKNLIQKKCCQKVENLRWRPRRRIVRS